MSSSITSLLLGLATADSLLIATSILMFGQFVTFILFLLNLQIIISIPHCNLHPHVWSVLLNLQI